jgi:hypothetical protein
MTTELVEIIKVDCIPERNCMLTVFDESGESGFLYFKDSQLIEVNTGKLWGKKALEAVFTWRMENYSIGELPLGIKRTLWEPLDKMIEEIAGEGSAEGLMDVFKQLPSEERVSKAAAYSLAEDDPLGPVIKQLREAKGCLAVWRQKEGGTEAVAGESPTPAISPEWVSQFGRRIQEVGDTLGAGLSEGWLLEIAECRIWCVPIGEAQLIIFASHEVEQDVFEEEMRNILMELQK